MHQACCVLPTRVSRQELSLMPWQKTHKGWIYPPPTQQSWQNESVLGIGSWNPLELSQNVMQNIPPIVVPISNAVFFFGEKIHPWSGWIGWARSSAPTFFREKRCFGSSSSTNSSGTGQLSRVGVGWLVGWDSWRLAKVKNPKVPNWGAKNWGNRLQKGC